MYNQFRIVYNGIINKRAINYYKKIIKERKLILKDIISNKKIFFYIIELILLIMFLIESNNKKIMLSCIIWIIMILFLLLYIYCINLKQLKDYKMVTEQNINHFIKIFVEICEQLNITKNSELKVLIEALDYKIDHYKNNNNEMKVALIGGTMTILIAIIDHCFNSIGNREYLMIIVCFSSITIVLLGLIFIFKKMFDYFLNNKLYIEISKETLINLRDYAYLFYNNKTLFKE